MRKFIDPNVACLLAIALFVRLLGIASRPVWYDEAFSILFSEKGLRAMLYGTLAPTGIGSADIHPLGYYTLLWVWMKLFGESLVAVRLLSILTGLISIYLIYKIGWEFLGDRSTARLGALFAALAPFQIHYSQEIRMYSLMTMFLLLATYSYQRGSKTRKWSWWLIFSISAAFAQYTHHLAAFYLTALALLPILHRDWRTLTRVMIAGMGSLILYAPWAIKLPAQFTKVQSSYWVGRPDISKFFTLILVYLTNTPLPAALVAAALFIALIIVSVGFIQTIKESRKSLSKTGLWLLYLSFFPALLLFVFSQWQPVYIERALLPSGAMFCLWLAWVVANTNLSLPLQGVFLGLLAVSSFLGIYQHVTYRDVPYGPFQALGASLRQRTDPEDVIIHASKMSMLPLMLFDRTLAQKYIDDPAGSGQDTLAAATQEVLEIQAERNMSSAINGAKQVWFIVFQRDIPALEANQDAQSSIQYLNSLYRLEFAETWNGLQVFLYEKKP
jgi:uncharacterized membrane protein